mmetsp:Transcript_11434/g.33707  ORF Transcript_11434/g.33707 Transcript_11434/m.33707 type:complete len:212 (+) Transcript_11434:515-1150(+)
MIDTDRNTLPIASERICSEGVMVSLSVRFERIRACMSTRKARLSDGALICSNATGFASVLSEYLPVGLHSQSIPRTKSSRSPFIESKLDRESANVSIDSEQSTTVTSKGESLRYELNWGIVRTGAFPFNTVSSVHSTPFSAHFPRSGAILATARLSNPRFLSHGNCPSVPMCVLTMSSTSSGSARISNDEIITSRLRFCAQLPDVFAQPFF